MNRFSLKIGLASAMIAVAAPAAATNGMRMIGFGPVQNSMGGASIAVPLDSSTAVTNPAGLSAVAPRVDLAAQAFMPDVKYSMTTPDPSFSGTSDRPTDFLPTLGAVFRPSEKLTAGIAALGTAGMGVDYASDPDGNRLMTSYTNARIAPAIAYRLNEQLSVGVALNLMWAQMSFEKQGQPRFSNTGSFGYGATAGVTYTPAKIVTFGAAFETRSYFQDFTWNIGGTDFALSFDQPMVATLGAAVRPAEGFVVALDAQWINWSDTMGQDLPRFSKPDGAGTFDMRWSDQWVVKVGAQYEVPGLKELKIRAGYDYGKTPLDAANFGANMAFPAVAEHHVTVGAGYDAGSWAVNAAFVYSPEATIAFSDPAGGINSFDSKMSQTAFELGGTYRF
jgi:long-chain fatty acid transport protein